MKSLTRQAYLSCLVARLALNVPSQYYLLIIQRNNFRDCECPVCVFVMVKLN